MAEESDGAVWQQVWFAALLAQSWFLLFVLLYVSVILLTGRIPL